MRIDGPLNERYWSWLKTPKLEREWSRLMIGVQFRLAPE